LLSREPEFGGNNNWLPKKWEAVVLKNEKKSETDINHNGGLLQSTGSSKKCHRS
jgi:hypothetical protein